jgi:hypothetical protein
VIPDPKQSAMTTPQPQQRRDDTFQLYDLRVVAVCPPGARIMCNAKDGDYFTLSGEMLSLPAGQGFSIYSIGMDRRIGQ